jgi:small nuclear ribonucleoprotein (snRNP)-like protein
LTGRTEEEIAMRETLRGLVGKDVVVDTRSPWMYIGRLESVQADSLLLRDVDVHDSGETHVPKERYVLAACETGIKANRHAVYVNLEYVVSVSLLSDVIKF